MQRLSKMLHALITAVMVDVALKSLFKDAILATLDQMAAYKMNKLHLHLTDDEGLAFRNPVFTERRM